MTDASLTNIGDLTVAQALTGPSHFNAHSKTSLPDIDKKAKDFEGMFMSQMLQPMFDTMKVDAVFGGGHGEESMRSFLVQEYGKAMAAKGNLGIATSVKAAMIRAQDASNTNIQPASKGAAYVNVQ